jgi:hypothetical protein
MIVVAYHKGIAELSSWQVLLGWTGGPKGDIFDGVSEDRRGLKFFSLNAEEGLARNVNKVRSPRPL